MIQLNVYIYVWPDIHVYIYIVNYMIVYTLIYIYAYIHIPHGSRSKDRPRRKSFTLLHEDRRCDVEDVHSP